MKRKELTKTFMMILNCKKTPSVSKVFITKFSVVRVNAGPPSVTLAQH